MQGSHCVCFTLTKVGPDPVRLSEYQPRDSLGSRQGSDLSPPDILVMLVCKELCILHPTISNINFSASQYIRHHTMHSYIQCIMKQK